MMLRSRKTRPREAGFSLVELLIAITIGAMVAATLGLIIYQVFDTNARSSNHMVAVRQLEQAGHFISQDTQQAEAASIADDPLTEGVTEVLTLTWYSYEYVDSSIELSQIEKHQAIYTLQDGELVRSVYYTDMRPDPDGVPVLVEAATIAEFLTLNPSPGGHTMSVTLTATVGSGSRQAVETRDYEITRRPM